MGNKAFGRCRSVRAMDYFPLRKDLGDNRSLIFSAECIRQLTLRRLLSNATSPAIVNLENSEC